MNLQKAERVWAIFKAKWPEDAVMRTFFRNKAGRTNGGYVLDPLSLAAETSLADRIGWDSYIQMNPTTRRTFGRCSGDEVTHWSWFLIDIDPIGPNPKLEEARDCVLSMVRGYFGIIEPEYVEVFSGRGVQLWFPLASLNCEDAVILRTEPLPRAFELKDTLENVRVMQIREAAPRAMGFWLDRFKNTMSVLHPDCQCTIDTSVSDLPRVMRMPFTINTKTGQHSALVREAAGENKNLAHNLLRYAPYELWRERTVDPAAPGEGEPWQKYVNYLTRGARIFLTEGASEGGRHRAAASAMLSLKEQGCSKEQTIIALLYGAQLSSPPLPSSQIIEMVERNYARRSA